MDANAKKILIVDDERSVVSYMNALLKDNGYQTLSASNGKEGYAKAVSEHPDLILLDITMPEESGIRMFRQIQENAETAGIPVFIVTGISHDFKGFIESRKEVAKPAAYFDKPVKKEELLAKIKEVLQ
jgi:response regulator RpfG family c-di-GMP phosphodiesterase